MRPSPNHGIQRLPNDDDGECTKHNDVIRTWSTIICVHKQWIMFNCDVQCVYNIDKWTDLVNKCLLRHPISKKKYMHSSACTPPCTSIP